MIENEAEVETTEFADLIRGRRAELGLSLAQFQERSIDPRTGTQVKSGWVYRLESGESVIPPRLPQLRALAAAVNLPLSQLQDAASAQFFGIERVWAESGEASALVRRAGRLTQDQREQLLRLIDAFAPPGQEDD
ncbi:helix-turn-helix transcriptional regulator [Streptomyces sp. NBC_00385]|uniref:helix-turn-helix transcriptional regulator n=1 Tax=Streptomyces sp. NBC_00385 TaxID=2975733 RepID=UPI002DD9AF07|nr:helix-turn-helix transcriptional regulator [Streptomyces sp. NBC_00385]WRZ05052.1 helix-turn-helix transcriptional regulator [Streptomyces sp. NBC_00385]